MAYGMQVFDSSGNKVLDTTTFTGKILGIRDITGPNTNGSVTDSDFTIGTPFYFAVPQGSSLGDDVPEFTFTSGTNTLSWDWGSFSGTTLTLIYGVF
jgi:hypothetical protein